MKEGFAYLKQQPLVLALGITHAIMMAGVVQRKRRSRCAGKRHSSGGAAGLGFLEAGWATGAIVGGLIASQLPQALRMPLYVCSVCRTRGGAHGDSVRRVSCCAVMMQILFGFCRALGGVVAQSSLMTIVPRHFMGRTQSAMAILTTVVQLFMSFALGWVAQGAGPDRGVCAAGRVYTGATVSAIRARQLLR